MGTSNLYKGPKGSALLPADYTGESDEQSEVDKPTNDDNPEQEESQEENAPCIGWTQAKRTFSRQIGKRDSNARLIVKTYIKALGGYKHAAKISASSKHVAGGIINLFLGGPDVIRHRIEQIGIVFEGRSTQDIFNDIYTHLCTGSASREDAIVDKALSQTFSELFESDLMSEHCLEIFTPVVLEFMVSHFITNSIFYKLLNEVAFGELTGNKDISDITRLENELKTFIDGLVSAIVSENLREGVTLDEVNKLVNELYEECYKVMEGMVE